MKGPIVAVAVLVAACLVGQAEPLPSGKLGHPLGTYLTIQGVRAEKGKVNPTCTLLVDTVNSNKLEAPVSIVVESLGDCYFPADTRIDIRGYESGRMIGLPYEVAKAENIPLPQAGWQFFRFFVMTSCVEPKELPKHDRSSSYSDRLKKRREEMKRDVEPTVGRDSETSAADGVASGAPRR